MIDNVGPKLGAPADGAVHSATAASRSGGSGQDREAEGDRHPTDRRKLAARIDSLNDNEQTAPDDTPTPPRGPARVLGQAGGWLARSGRTVATHARGRARTGAVFIAERLAPQAAAGSRAVLAGGRQGLRTALAAGRRVWQGSARLAREQALPRLGRAARHARERLRPAELDKDYRRLLLLVHSIAFDRRVEHLLFAPTFGRGGWRHARGRAEVAKGPALHGATPRRVFEWAMRAIPERVNRFTFVDLGAGRGRVLLMATAHEFERVVGLELDRALHDDCAMNIAQYPRSRMKCRDVECLLRPAGQLDVPEEPAVFHMFAMTAEPEIDRAVARIAASYARAPRRIYLICVGRGAAEPVARQPVFEPLPAHWRLRLRTRLFSPYPLALFRSLA